MRKSNVRECWRYGGSTTALSRASRGSCTRRSQESRVTKENSRLFGRRYSWAKLSNRFIASRKDPAVRTCSQVKVVRLAILIGSVIRFDVHADWGNFTAKWRYWSIDRLNEDTLPTKLKRGSRELYFRRSGEREGGEVYLIATLCIKQDPAKLNYLSRVLGNIHAMFITRCGHMDDHITVEIGFLPLIVCHPSILIWGCPRVCLPP